MQVILIGSGNIATLMGQVLLNNGHTIRQVFSRNQIHAEKLAVALQATPVADPMQLVLDADLYLIAVTDNAIKEVADWLRVKDKLVVHTAGSVSKEVLRSTSTSYGVLWPIKMVRAHTQHFAGETIAIDANTDAALEQIRSVALAFSTNIMVAADLMRAKMHMIATFTVNFSNHLFHLAADLCQRENIPFNAFYPLIRSAVEQLPHAHPRDLQAGPAFRGDEETITMHKNLLALHPKMQVLYDLFTHSIQSEKRHNEVPATKPNQGRNNVMTQ